MEISIESVQKPDEAAFLHQSESSAIRVRNLTKKFRYWRGWFRSREIIALDQVSFQVMRGESFGIVGPNGSGKSTLLRILSTILLPSSGEAWIGGYSTIKQEGQIKSFVGMVPSEPHGFLGRLNAHQNLEFFAALQRLDPNAIRRRVSFLLQTIGLADCDDQPIWTYSTGQRQRLNIARALLHDPSVLLFDEPTKGLDPWGAKLIRAWIRTELIEKQGKTLLIATNQMEDVHELCDRVAFLKQGRIMKLEDAKAKAAIHTWLD